MRVESHPCFVLHKRAYRETSLLIDVFSSLHGRVGLVARGAKRKQSGQAALIQPFRCLSMAWSARGDLGTLVSVEPEAGPEALVGATLMAGFYINELVLRLLHRDESHPRLFDDYVTALQQLHENEAVALRLFECRLLEAVGYGLIIDHDITTGAMIEPGLLYEYVSEQGPRVAEHATRSHVCIHGSTLIALGKRSLQDEQSLREAKQLLRQEIGQHLGGRPLATRNLYQAYLQNRRGNNDPAA